MRAALELERRSPNRRVDARQDWNRADSEIVAPIAQLTRRAFLGRSAFGLGALGLASLLNENLFAGVSRTASTAGLRSKLHFAPRAKRIIFLFMSGGPSQLDLFDPKPKLNELNGQPMPES